MILFSSSGSRSGRNRATVSMLRQPWAIRQVYSGSTPRILAHFDQIDFKKQGYISPEEWATVQSMMGHRHHASGSATPEDPNSPKSTDAKPAPTAAATPAAKPEKVASASTTATH